MEAGLRPATTQLEYRQRRFGLQLLSLPQGGQAREVVSAASDIGQRLDCALRYSGGMESTILLEEPETLDADILLEEEATAKAEAECPRRGLTMFTDGSRFDSGASGYSVVWQNGQRWVGIKTHMDYNQEAYGAECASLARALEIAARRQTTPERVTIFTDVQAAIKRMASEDPGPGQMYAIRARKHIAALRKVRPDITIEIRWCPAHKGIPGNEKADERAKLAAEEPGSHGVEYRQYSDRYGRRPMPLPRSLAHLKREISEKKWSEARRWAEGRITAKKYRLPDKQRPNRVVAGCSKRLAVRLRQLKTGHCLTGQYLRWTKN
jgi:ribonuclease HI